MPARDVLGVILDQFLVIGQVGSIPNWGNLRTGRAVNQRQLSIDQVAHFGRDNIGQAEQLGGHGKESHIPAGGLFERRAFQAGILLVSGLEQTAGQGIQRGD